MGVQMRFFADLDFSASIVASRCFVPFLRKKSHLRIAQIRLRRGLVWWARPIIVSLISPKKSLCLSALGGGCQFARSGRWKFRQGVQLLYYVHILPPPPFFAVLAISCGRMRRGVPFDFRRLSKKPKNESPPFPLSPHLYISQNFLFSPATSL